MHLVMETLSVECLRCGDRRDVHARAHRSDTGECLRCGYVGWAPSVTLDEAARRSLRVRPLEIRRLRAIG